MKPSPVTSRLLYMTAALGSALVTIASGTELSNLTWTIANGEVTITGASESIAGDLEIPKTIDGAQVAAIGSWAFQGRQNLESVTIPDSVTTIGNNAFESCTNLQSVAIPYGVETIGDRAFLGCENLESATIPDSVISIGNWTFAGCMKLADVSLGSELEYIGTAAFGNTSVPFEGDGDLKYLTTSEAAFIVDGSAASGDLVLPDQFKGLPVRSVSGFALSAVTSITIPEGVTGIGARAFSGCMSLRSVTIPDSVTSIGRDAFYVCLDLEEVTIGEGVTKISNGTFRSCKSLKRVTIPNSVSTIELFAFLNCTSLEQVTIGEGVTLIETNAFATCTSLESVTIPNSVKSIEFFAFGNCASLTNLHLGEGLEHIAPRAFADTAIPFEGDSELKYLTSSVAAFLVDASAARGDIVIPDQFNGLPVRSVSAFFKNEAITSVTIPKGVMKIGKSAFRDCTSLRRVMMPEGLAVIGEYAFLRCTSLERLAIPGSVISVHDRALQECERLVEVIFDGPAPAVYSDSSDPFEFRMIPSPVQALVRPRFLDSFGGEGADWRGMTVVALPAEPGPEAIADVSLDSSSMVLNFTGPAELDGWKVMGSSNLQTFADDLTSLTDFSETSPGHYQAVVDLNGRPASYFVRVER